MAALALAFAALAACADGAGVGAGIRADAADDAAGADAPTPDGSADAVGPRDLADERDVASPSDAAPELEGVPDAVPDIRADADPGADSDAGAGTGKDAGASDSDAGRPPPPLCAGNDDDRIEASELPIDPGAGVSVLYSVNRPGTTAAVPDLAGEWLDGVLVWDFTAFDADRDHVVADRLLPPEEQWFGASFPDADWAGSVDAEGAVLGVYRLDEADGSVALLGLASVAAGETLLRYEPPVRLYRFPIEKGDTYASLDVEAVGRHEGVDYPLGTLHLVHEYRFTVDRVGEVRVPAGTFRALRIAAEVEARAENLGVPSAVERRRVYYFLSECAGLVARVGSVSGDAQPDFATAAEYRRLGLPPER